MLESPEHRSGSASRCALLAGVGVAALFLLLFRESLDSGRLPQDVVAPTDVTFVGVVYEQAALQIRAGRVPLWFHEFDGGAPLAASWMYGLLYPGALLFAALPLGAAFAWTAALHAGFGAAGMSMFLRRRGCDAAGATAGALLFAVSEYFVGRAVCGHVNLLMPVAWAPWILRFIDGCAKGERRAVPLLALAGGAGLLAGHVQIWIVLGPLVVAFAATEAWMSSDRGGAFRRLAAGAALALGVAAVQIAIAAEYLAHAAPVVEKPEIVWKASAPPLAVASKLLFSWVSPDPNDVFDYRPDFRGIAGVWAFALAAWAVVRRAPRRWLWAGFAVAGLVAAIGTRSPATAWLQHVPPFSMARTPGRLLLVSLVGVSVLAGHGVSLLPRPAHAWSATAAAGALAVALGIPGVRSIPADLHGLDVRPHLAEAAASHRILTSEEFYRCTNLEAAGLRTFRGPCPIPLRAFGGLFRDPTPAIGWWCDVGAVISPKFRADAARPPTVEDLTGVDARYPEAMGGARFFADAARGVPPEEVLARMRSGERTLFLDAPDAERAAPRTDAQRPARVTAWAVDEIRVEAESDGDGWLLVSTPHYPGWTCAVDGAATPLVRANIAFCAARIPSAGRHEVVLRYEPVSFRVAGAASLVSVLVAVALLLRRGGARR
jgi:hypothetical protein